MGLAGGLAANGQISASGVTVSSPGGYPSAQLPVLLLSSYRQSTDTDWGPAVQAAYTAAVALGGAIIDCPAGTLTLQTGLPANGLTIQSGHTGLVLFRGQGFGVTTFKLTSSVYCLMQCNGGPAVLNTLFGAVNLTIDANGARGNGQGGVVLQANTRQLNLTHIYFDVEVINVGIPTATHTLSCFNISCNLHPADAPSTVTFPNIPAGTYVLQDIHINGELGIRNTNAAPSSGAGCGSTGVQVNGFTDFDQGQGAAGRFLNPITANCFVDRVYVGQKGRPIKIDHCPGGKPTGAGPGSGVQVGGDSIMGHVEVYAWVHGSDDVNVELDDQYDCVAEITSIDPYNEVLLANNFGNTPVTAVDGQWVADPDGAHVSLRLKHIRLSSTNGSNPGGFTANGRNNSILPNMTLELDLSEYCNPITGAQPLQILGRAPRFIGGEARITQKWGEGAGSRIMACSTQSGQAAVTVVQTANEYVVPVEAGAVVTGPNIPANTTVLASPAPTATSFTMSNNASGTGTQLLGISLFPRSSNHQFTANSQTYQVFGAKLQLIGRRSSVSGLKIHHEVNGTVDANGHSACAYDHAAVNVQTVSAGALDMLVSTAAKATQLDTAGANSISCKYRQVQMLVGGNDVDTFNGTTHVNNTTVNGAGQNPSLGSLIAANLDGWPSRGTFAIAGTVYSYTGLTFSQTTPTLTGVRGPSSVVASGATISWAGGVIGLDYLPDLQGTDNITYASNALQVAPGADAGVSEAAVENRLVWLNYNTQSLTGQIGEQEDCCVVSPTMTPGATISGAKLGVIGMWLPSNVPGQSNTFIEAYVTDNGVNSIFNLDKVIAGARTNVSTVTLGARIANGVPFRVRLKQQGNAVTADYYANTSTLPSVATAGTNTLSWTLTGADITTFGEGIVGYIGFSWIPADPAATVTNMTFIPFNVLGGKLTTKALVTTGFNNTVNGINWNVDASQARVRGHFVLDACEWSALTGNGNATPVEVAYASSQGSATDLRQYVYARDCKWFTHPAPSTPTVGASGTAVVNTSHSRVRAYQRGGTLTTPFLQVTQRAAPNSTGSGAPTAQQIANATGDHYCGDLLPGDSLTPTYSGAPTVVFVPYP